MSLNDRTVLITGANGGLGRAAARTLAARGARLALVGQDRGKLETLAGELDLPASHLLLQAADLRDPAAAGRLVAAVMGWSGRLDVLLQLVGGWTGGKGLAEVPAADLEHMLAQHLWTTFHLVQAAVPPMLAGGWGRLIAISSPYAVHPAAGGGPYAIAKAAQDTLFLTLAQELKGSGVTANLIQVRSIDAQSERLTHPSPKNASWTTLDEIIGAVIYLCSDVAGQVNGARLPLFGAPA